MDTFWGILWVPHNTTEGPETTKNNYKTEKNPIWEASTCISLAIAFSLVVKKSQIILLWLWVVSVSRQLASPGTNYVKMVQNVTNTRSKVVDFSMYYSRPQVATI